MIRLKDIAIQKKLRISLLFTAYVVLFLTLSIQTVYDLLNTKNVLNNKLISIAEVVGANLQAALIFDDKDTAIQLLKGFSSLKEIELAVLYRKTGSMIAYYHKNMIEIKEITSKSGFSLRENKLSILHKISMDAEEIGSIYIESNLDKLYQEIWKNILVALIAAIFSVIAAYFLALRLQRLVGEPIVKLTNLISEMMSKKQYDKKVQTFNQDEIGELYKGFNAMMNQLNLRDAKLRENKNILELEVKQRTKELNQSNLELKKTVFDLKLAKDAALDAVQAKSIFLANMSHEIRTPMNGVLGMLEILKDQETDKEKMDFVHTAYISAESLLQIINDILDFSKIEAGKMTLECIELNLRVLIDDVCTLLLSKAKEKKIELNYYLDPSIPMVLKGDPVRLRQILMNLLGNAIKFTDQGTVTVSVKKLKLKDNKIAVVFSVQDTGIGIKKQVKNKLFSAFTQADGSTTRKFGGTGLGLTISRQLVHLMNGEIRVQSQEGKGSIFAFVIDMIIAKNQVEENLQSTTMKQKRALIIDDNAINRKILKHYLTSWGAEFNEVSNAMDAISLIRDQKYLFDIIYLDLHMPEIDGFMFCQRLYKLKIEQFPPIILLNSSGEIDSQLLSRHHISACLTKPYRQARLLKETLSVLQHDTHTYEKVVLVSDNPESTFNAVNIKILLVEDNIINQKVALTLLNKLGCKQVTLAQNGLEAVKFYQERPFDLILMDCQMPILSGYEATESIRETNSNFNLPSVPIIAMTANAMEGDKEKCLASGMNDYLSKPIKKELIIKMLKKWVKN